MASTSETILLALYAALRSGLPSGVKTQRNGTIPTSVPDDGLVILRDGDPGEPEVMLSPLLYYYEHEAEVEIFVDLPEDTRDAAFDTLKQAVGAVISADRTLGGLCDYIDADAPAPSMLPVANGNGMKCATISVVLRYGSPDPLL